MLVFQSDLSHLKDRCGERMGMTWQSIVRIVAEINRYLPDDWRMTRSRNNFRIQVVSPEGNPALVGHSYRTGDGHVVHIIDSMFRQGFFDQHDLKAATTATRKPVKQSTKREHPETIQPNLYFLLPCPEDSHSPLFARQYEKVSLNKQGQPTGDQFHRIHPIDKSGLDLHHYRWIRWTTNGDVAEVDFPNAGYHGKDYWDVPLLGKGEKRRSLSHYLDVYNRELKSARIEALEGSYGATIAYEVEYKYEFHGHRDDFFAMKDLIDSVALEMGYTLEGGKRAVPQTDTYFDDDSWSLLREGVSFRLRKRKNTARITLKRRFGDRWGEMRKAYRRIEEETILSPKQEIDLIEGRPINLFPYQLLVYVIPKCGALRPVMNVTNERTMYTLKDPSMLRAELCLDSITYQIEGREFGPYYEVEVESRGVRPDRILQITTRIQSAFDQLRPYVQSKYERGFTLMHRNFPRQVPPDL